LRNVKERPAAIAPPHWRVSNIAITLLKSRAWWEAGLRRVLLGIPDRPLPF
jgi:hypothetical protein